MSDPDAYHEVFQRLRSILMPHVPPLVITEDTDGICSLAVDFPEAPIPSRYFGGVNVRRTYVSFYLMPVYAAPELLIGASGELLKRKQGKSCFNFSKVDENLLRELTELTNRAVPAYLERLPKIFSRKAR